MKGELMLKLNMKLLLVLGMLILLPQNALSADRTGQQTPRPDSSRQAPNVMNGDIEYEIGVHGEAYVGFTAQADYSDGGAASVLTAGTSTGWEGLEIGYEVKSFAWDKVEKLPFGNKVDNPWDTLHDLSVGYHDSYMFNDTWGILGGGQLGMAFEKEVDSSLYGMAYAGIIYALNREWSFSLGGGVEVNHVEVSFLPLAGINFRQAEQEGFSFSLGVPETEVRYRFNEMLAVKAAADYEGGLYRLADDSTVSKEGYASMEGAKAGLYVDFSPLENVSLVAGPEVSFMRSTTIYDNDGDKIDDHDQDAGFGGMARLEIRF